MDVKIKYVQERQNEPTSKKGKGKGLTARNCIGLWLCLLFSYATQGGPESKPDADYEASQPKSNVVASFLELLVDQSNAQQFFDKAKVEQWTRSVVAIGIHEPLVGTYSWYHRRTGFAVDSRYGGRLIASYDVPQLAAGQYRIHGHPFKLPPAENSIRASLKSDRVVSYMQPHSSSAIPAVTLADWNNVAYENKFPVVLLGFEDGLPVHFYTHSVGPTDDPVRIQLASRPYGVFGEFFGAPVFNANGEVVGIYAPKDNKPTYLVSGVVQ